MRTFSYLLLLVLLSACKTSQPSFYRAPRRAQRYYHQRQHLHEHERTRLRNAYLNIGW